MKHLDKPKEQHVAELSELLQRLIELEVACSKLLHENNEYTLPTDETDEKTNRVNNLLQTIEVLIASIRRLLTDGKDVLPV